MYFELQVVPKQALCGTKRMLRVVASNASGSQNYALRAIPSASLPPTHEAVGGYGSAPHFIALHLSRTKTGSLWYQTHSELHFVPKQTLCGTKPSCNCSLYQKHPSVVPNHPATVVRTKNGTLWYRKIVACSYV